MAVRKDLFTFALNNLNGGKIQEIASEKLNELVLACQETLKKGEFILKLDVVPDKSGNGQYFIVPNINTKAPQMANASTMFWATPEGNLEKTDPAQRSLFEDKEKPTEVRSVEHKPEVREV